MTTTTFNQLTTHRGQRVELPGPYGGIAALQNAPESPWITALLVPGYTGSKEDFAPILDGLADAGVRAFAIDLPGQFESAGPAAEDLYRPGPLGSVVAELIAELTARDGLPLMLLGHSYGGLVAQAAVIAGAPVAGLTLLCSGPAAFTSGPRLEALILGEPVLRTEGLEAAYAYRDALTVALRGEQEIRLAEFRRRRFLASTAAGFLGMGAALREQASLTAAVAATEVPVSVIAGVDDDAWPLDVQRAMAAELGTELELIQDAAHSPAVENPAGLLTVLLAKWELQAR